MLSQIFTKQRLPFIYQSDQAALSANASTTNTIVLSTDGDFECWGIRIKCSQDADTDFNPNNVQVRIRDGSTGREMANGEIQQALISPRTGENRFPYPITFTAGGTIQIDYTDLSGATNNVRVAFWGYLVLIC